MAGIFDSQVGGPSGSSVTPQRPVQQPPPSALSIGSTLSSLMPSQAQLAQGQAARAKQQEAIGNTEFAQKQLELSDAVASGSMSSAEARRRARVNFSRAIADNPNLIESLTKTHKDIMNTSGLGKVVAEGTEEEQQRAKLYDEALSAGWARPGMSPEQQNAAITNYQDFQRAGDILTRQQAQLTFERGQIGLQSDRIGLQSSQVSLARNKLGLSTDQVQHQSAVLGLQEKQEKRRSQQALATITDNYGFKLRGDGQDLIDRMNRGDITPEQAVAAWDQQFQSVTQITSQVGAQAGGDYASGLMSPLAQTHDLIRKQLTGEMTTEVANAQMDKNRVLYTQEILEDPKALAAASLNKIFPNSDLLTQNPVNKMVVQIMDKAVNPDKGLPNMMEKDADDKVEVKNTLGILKSTMNAVRNGTAVDKEGAEGQVDVALNRMLQSVDAYGYATDSPEDYNNMVDFLASSEYGSYVAGKGTAFNREAATNAKMMIEQQYEQQALPVIEDAWKNAQTTTSVLPTSGVLGTTATTASTSSVIEPIFNGGGIQFTVRGGDRNPRLAAKVKELNRNVGPIVNRLIRMSAHLEGNTDYKGQWERNYSRIFMEGEESPDQN